MCKILIVDDNPTNLFLYKETLERKGNNVFLLSNGDKICDNILNYKPDVILLDIFLPGKNGFQIYKDLKGRSDICSKIPIVFISAAFSEDEIVKKTGTSTELVMAKPIKFEKLNLLVEQLKNKNKKDLCHA